MTPLLILLQTCRERFQLRPNYSVTPPKNATRRKDGHIGVLGRQGVEGPVPRGRRTAVVVKDIQIARIPDRLQ